MPCRVVTSLALRGAGPMAVQGPVASALGRGRDVRWAAVVPEAVEGCRAVVAQDAVGGQGRGPVPRERRGWHVADEVDPEVDWVEAARLQAPADGRARKAERRQLRRGHRTVLSPG